jgi:hypothetical protein
MNEVVRAFLDVMEGGLSPERCAEIDDLRVRLLARPVVYTADYRNAPAGIGPLAGQWNDKPWRLVYRLCTLLDRVQ